MVLVGANYNGNAAYINGHRKQFLSIAENQLRLVGHYQFIAFKPSLYVSGWFE